MLESRLAGVEQLLARLNILQDPHNEYTLLLSCFSFLKMAYSMRMVDVSQHEEFLINFDKAVRSGEGAGGSSQPGPVDTGIAAGGLGGIGFRQAELHGPAAFLASYSASQPLMKEILGKGVAVEGGGKEERDSREGTGAREEREDVKGGGSQHTEAPISRS